MSSKHRGGADGDRLGYSRLWVFSIYQEIPKIPVGLEMEHDFSVCSTGKFPEKVELLKR